MLGGLLTYACTQMQGSLGCVPLAAPASELQKDKLAGGHNRYRADKLWAWIPAAPVLYVLVGLSLIFLVLAPMSF